ncbi:uncharacterized protein [Leptinotarsa decemlineata]|uniref:uncharacterized protein n=1 Tax=Leptinotarsa decemlineata TaxID=7539 RepID=UPI003D306F9C
MDRNKPRPRINTEGQDRASKDNTSENEENDHIGEDHNQSQDKQPRSTASTESDQTTDNAKNSSASEFKSPLPKKRKYVANQDPMLQSAFDLLKSSASAAKAVATASTLPATGLDQYQLYANYLAGKFRGYSKPTYMTVEHQINNILYNADCGQYEYQRGYSTLASTYPMAETRPPQMSVNSSSSNRAQSLAPYMTENQVQQINNSPTPEMNHSPVTQVDDSSMDSEDSFRELIHDINY